MQLALFNDPSTAATDEAHQTFTRERVLDRLRAMHGSPEPLDASDPLVSIGVETHADGSITKNSFGVLNLSWQAGEHPEWAAMIDDEVKEVRARIKEAHGVNLRFLIWAGMGGSVEDKTAYNLCGLLKRAPKVYSLDSTDPSKLRAILEDMVARTEEPLAELLKSTLVVGMALGMTSYEPVVNLEKLSALYAKYKIDGRANFCYITLTGSLLDQFASKQGYRRVDLQPDGAYSTAGRHSSPLTRGSLWPLALCGVDIAAWLRSAVLTDEEIAMAWRLAAFLHSNGTGRRDKVTLLLPKPWSGAGLWTKQNVEESLGKSDALGIKIVIGEKVRLMNYHPSKSPQQDRMFLAVQIKGVANADADKITLLRRKGYSLAILTFNAGATLAHYMQFIHYVVCGLGVLRKMNFVTQPSVELYKGIANRIHAEGVDAEWKRLTGGHRAGFRGLIALYSARAVQSTDAAAVFAQLCLSRFGSRRCEYGELTFFGDTRYSEPGRAVRKAMDRGADWIFREALKAPCDVYEGPAMNHSYHEMVIGHGRCLSAVIFSEKQEQIPEAGYDANYHRAQFLATKLALEQRNREVVAIVLKDLSEKSIAVLEAFFKQVYSILTSGTRTRPAKMS